MYYVIERTYIGFDHDANIDASRIEITTEPEANGSYNDWRTTNHGSFDNIDIARGYIARAFGVTRTHNAAGESFADAEYYAPLDNVVEIHKLGAYEPMSASHSQEWAWAGFEQDIEAATTDAEITALIEEYAAEARNQGYELDQAAVTQFAVEYRDELLAELE